MDSELVGWRERVCGYGDLQLMADLQRLANVDRRCEVRILIYLAEIDQRRLHLARGYSSLFVYAKAVLRMSEAQAYLRIQAARVSRRYPAALEMLGQGALNLSTLKLLAPHLKADNHLDLLERARGKTKQEVELLVAELAPRPDAPTRLRKVRVPAARREPPNETPVPNADSERPHPRATNDARATEPSAHVQPAAAPSQATLTAQPDIDNGREQLTAAPSQTALAAQPDIDSASPHSDAARTETQSAGCIDGERPTSSSAPTATRTAVAVDAPQPVLALEALRAASGAVTLDPSQPGSGEAAQTARRTFALVAPRASCSPLRPGRFKLELTAGQALPDTLKQLQHLLRHQIPSGNLGVITMRALEELRAKLQKQRFAQLAKPKAEQKRASELSDPQVEFGTQGSGALERENAQTMDPRRIQLKHVSTHSQAQGEPTEAFSEQTTQCSNTQLNLVGTRSDACTEQPMLYSDTQLNPAGMGGDAHHEDAAERGDVCLIRFDGGEPVGRLERPQAKLESRGSSPSRYIPRAVVRAVYERDGAQCTFVSSDGVRCSERGMLELHHVHAFARGGDASVENIKVACRAHNGFYAEQDFGAAHTRAIRQSVATRRVELNDERLG